MKDKVKYPPDMDEECIPLCDALNALDGIETIESCCGHGSRRFYVIFLASNVESLKKIVHSIYVLNEFQKSSLRKFQVFVGCNDVGDLHYRISFFQDRKIDNASRLTYMLVDP